MWNRKTSASYLKVQSARVGVWENMVTLIANKHYDCSCYYLTNTLETTETPKDFIIKSGLRIFSQALRIDMSTDQNWRWAFHFVLFILFLVVETEFVIIRITAHPASSASCLAWDFCARYTQLASRWAAKCRAFTQTTQKTSRAEETKGVLFVICNIKI